MSTPTITMFRPVGPDELALLEANGFRAWPPRLEWQPIFYPVTNERYAEEITRMWNVPEFGVGYVTQFEVDADYTNGFEIHTVGASHCTEWWIPSEELETFNAHIVGTIEVISEFHTRD